MSEGKAYMMDRCIHWLEDALYDIQCGNLSLGESLIWETVEALKEMEGVENE